MESSTPQPASDGEKALCEICSTAFRTCTVEAWRNPWARNIPLHTSFYAFVEAVRQGCFICNFIVRLFGPEGEQIFWKVVHALVHVVELPTTKTLTTMWLCMRPPYSFAHVRGLAEDFLTDAQLPMGLKEDIEAMHMAARNNHRQLLHLYKVEDSSVPPGCKETAQRFGRFKSGSTGSDDTFEFMAKCIRACESQHEECRRRASSASPAAWYPTRLLDTHSLDTHSIRIVGRDQVTVNSRYATLSHRWNDSVPALSVERLEKEWEAGIPLAVLPPTFKDFVTAARRLGFRYAWIDSLCIIQNGDAGADWGRESQTMDLVYRNSSCNFAANWPSKDAGLFNSRDHRWTHDLAFTLSVRETEDGEVTNQPYILGETSFWETDVTSAPLNERGWVVQERFLSPRAFHFGRFEVYFECCESASTERYYLEGARPPANDTPARGFYPPMDFKFKIDKTLGNHSPYKVWKTIRQAYEKCQLSFPSDSLVAISGVARYLRPFFTDCNYITGIWTWRIEEQLEWARTSKYRLPLPTLEELGPATRFTGLPAVIASTPYRAPSFSWASVECQINDTVGYEFISKPTPVVTALIINYRNARGIEDIAVCEDIYDFLPAGSTPRVEMKVVGRLNRARLVSHGSTELYLYPQVKGFDLVNANRESFRPFTSPRRKLVIAHLDFNITQADVPDIEAGMFYYMVWSESLPTDSGYTAITCQIFALIDPEMGRFRRIGCTKRLVDRRNDVYQNQQLASEQATIPCWEYNPKTNQHTIYVV